MSNFVIFENSSEGALNYILHQLLGYGEGHLIYYAFECFEINSVDDFLLNNVQKDLKDAVFFYPDPDIPSKRISAVLSIMQLCKF